MTPNNAVDPTKAGTLAQQIVTILINEDSVTRQRAMQAAMMLLGEATLSAATTQPAKGHAEDNSGDLASFFNRGGDMKPSDYAHLCAAYHYSLYGSAPFSIMELKAIATDAGVVVPDRLDMTLSHATKKGKKLFQGAGKGSFKPTATGGVVFAERWGVKPGRRTKPFGAPKTD